MSDVVASILIVTWNRRAEVARAIRSALAQTCARKEIVVVDNGSTDGTAEMVRSEFPDVHLVRSERNLGCPSGRNFGFGHCRGRYIYMLDDDGWLKDDAVALCVQRAESDPAIGVVMSRIMLMKEGNVVGQYPLDQPEPGYRADFSGGCSLIRRDALASAGVFPDDFVRQGEETDLALRLLEAGYFCFHEPAAVMFHAMSPVGRNSDEALFYTLRNANRTGLRLWPTPWCLLRPLVSFGHAVRYAVERRAPSLPWRFLASLAGELRSLSRHRRAVSPATFRLFRQLQATPTSRCPSRPSTARPELRREDPRLGSGQGSAPAEPSPLKLMPALSLSNGPDAILHSSPGTCAVLVDRIGPYHFARLSALAMRMRTVAIESFAMDQTYAWSKVTDGGAFERHTLLDQANPGWAQGRALTRRVSETLSRIAPSVVAIPGWSEKSALAALRWCLRTGTPALVLSATFEAGRPRVSWKEAVKRRVVRLFSAGLGGGAPHARYLERLGLTPSSVFQGYDVVDNQHFAARAEAARQEGAALRRSLGLPESYFLTICRFIEEKNLETLLNAYAEYRRKAGAESWKLVLLGDGPLKAALVEQRQRLGLTEDVLMPGFKQYLDLPQYYGLAGAFVLPSGYEPWGLVVNEAMAAGLPLLVSERCGCAADLVAEGQNGFTFAPTDVGRLTELLTQMAAPETDRAAMGEASRRIIARWTPEVFARNLERAAMAASATPRRTAGLFDKLILWALLRR
jgi:GT2 family glycosyltransferase